MGELYCLTSPSGMSYIGWTVHTAQKRFRNHVRGARKRESATSIIHRAIRKYGPEAFVVKTLLVSNDKEYLKTMERAAIRVYKTTCPNGYNLTPGGDGVTELLGSARARWLRNVRHVLSSPDHRKKLSLAAKKNGVAYSERLKKLWADPKWRKRQLAKVAAGQSSEEYKARHSLAISLAQKKRFQDPEQRHIARIARLGKLHSTAAKRAVGVASVKRWASVGYRKRLSRVHKNSWRDPEIRSKRITAMTETARRPEARARKSVKMRAVFAANPEIGAKIASKVSQAWADPARRARWIANLKVAWIERKVKKG